MSPRRSKQRTTLPKIEPPAHVSLPKRNKRLTGEKLNAIVFKRLRKHTKLSVLEGFATFMGKAQLVEFGLKGLLVRQYGYDSDRIEKWNLGQTIRELRKCGLRQDFVGLIEELNDYRNHIAHDLLVDEALTRRWFGSSYASRFAWKHLSHGLYYVEAAIVVHDFLFGDEPAPRRRRRRVARPRRSAAARHQN